MRRFRLGVVAALVLAIALVSSDAAAAPGHLEIESESWLTLLHGLPGYTVDLVVEDEVIVEALEPGELYDLSDFGGEVLVDFEVRDWDDDSTLIGPFDLELPEDGHVTLVAHFDALDEPVVTVFDNDVDPLPAGVGRLTIRHTAALPAVDVIVGAARLVTELLPGEEFVTEIPEGALRNVAVALTKGSPAVGLPDIWVGDGEHVILYFVGSLEDDSFAVYEQVIAGLGEPSAKRPRRINAGDSPLPASVAGPVGPVLLGLVAAASAMGVGSEVLRRRGRAERGGNRR